MGLVFGGKGGCLECGVNEKKIESALNHIAKFSVGKQHKETVDFIDGVIKIHSNPYIIEGLKYARGIINNNLKKEEK